MLTTGYTSRHRSMLQAVSEGRGELVGGALPNLAVDGRWCDHTATIELVRANLVRPAKAGMRAPAVLTTSGVALLTVLTAQ